MSKILNYDPINNFIIFSEPRGGSTWVTEIISLIPRTAIIWEPLHLDYAKNFREINFGWRQYIPENYKWDEAYYLFQKVFSGKILNTWTTQITDSRRLFNSKFLIIKFCRGNALLPWLTKQFQFNKKPIYLLRHPFALLSSQMKHSGWSNMPDKISFDIPNIPFNHIYNSHKEFLKTIKYKDELLLVNWCITNAIVLDNQRNNIDWITLNYEDLVLEPKNTMTRIINEWNVDFDYKLLIKQINKRSITGDSRSPLKGMNQVKYWESFLTQNQINRLRRVLDYFNVKSYTTDPLPRISYTFEG